MFSVPALGGDGLKVKTRGETGGLQSPLPEVNKEQIRKKLSVLGQPLAESEGPPENEGALWGPRFLCFYYIQLGTSWGDPEVSLQEELCPTRSPCGEAYGPLQRRGGLRLPPPSLERGFPMGGLRSGRAPSSSREVALPTGVCGRPSVCCLRATP